MSHLCSSNSQQCFGKYHIRQNIKHFLDNGLISPKESEYRPCDSCVNLLPSITHDIFISFDDGSEVRGVFLDLPKAFDKVKPKQYNRKADMSFNGLLKNHQQIVVLNGQVSSWTKANPGIQHESILGTFLLLIYINNLPNGLQSN